MGCPDKSRLSYLNITCVIVYTNIFTFTDVTAPTVHVSRICGHSSLIGLKLGILLIV